MRYTDVYRTADSTKISIIPRYVFNDLDNPPLLTRRYMMAKVQKRLVKTVVERKTTSRVDWVTADALTPLSLV